MGNKLFVMLFLGSSMMFAQDFVKVEIKLDSITSIIKYKEEQVKALNADLDQNMKVTKRLTKELNETKDSLKYYKDFYDLVHEKLSPRLIARIKEE